MSEQGKLQLYNFLPKYPYINRKPYEEYPQGFYQGLYEKKEFNELKLEKTEEIPKERGELFKRQKIIARFLSSYTPYNSSLVFHSMGSGKTCSAFGTTEMIREQDEKRISMGETPLYTGVITLARGKGLINNLINELVFKCSKQEKYVPEDYQYLTENEKVRRIKKKIREYYSFYTFFTFAKNISELSDKKITDIFSNKIIIIDEVHNIKKAEDIKEDVQATYEQIFRFLHLIKNTKILLLSGTPIRDTADEIAMVMNLILPENSLLPIGENFNREYMERNENGNLVVSETGKTQLKRFFKGRVSYLSNIQDVNKKYMGNHSIFNVQTFTIYREQMSKFQSEYYERAFLSDKEGKKGVYSGARQASLFVYPGGLYGKEGFKTITTSENKFRLSTELKTILSGTREQMLKNLKKYSIKYYTLIKLLLVPDRNSFVYCSIVKGGGAILLSLVLERFGFSRANGQERSEGLRYGILTNLTTSERGFRNIVERYNRPDNYKGDYIKTIIGSKVIGEGLSFSNVLDIFVLTPFFNYAETSQAIYRGIRTGADEELIKHGISPVKNIYQFVADPIGVSSNSDELDNPAIESIDYKMYRLSASKDITTKSIERLMKESAIDCQLTKAANYSDKLVDNSRECEYQSCDYKCDGITNENPKKEDIDDSTYNLYYSDIDRGKIISDITDKFKRIFISNLSEYPRDYIFLSSIDEIINTPVIINDKYGFSSFLKEDHGKYFLTGVISSQQDNLFSDYYTKNPFITTGLSFNEIVKKKEVDYIENVIGSMYSSPDIIEKTINKLPPQVIEYIIEASILANSIGKSNEFTLEIAKYFSPFIVEDLGNKTIISSFLYGEKILRCLSPTEKGISKWEDCSEEMMKKYNEKIKEKQGEMEKNPFGYYGIYDTIKNEFFIRDLRKEVDTTDKRKIFSGKKCNPSWSRNDLVELAIIIKLDYPVEFAKNMTREQLLKKLDKIPVINGDMTREDLSRALYWSGQNKKITCDAIQKWFEENNLLQIGKKERKKG
jgi:superfamily II DNA or RNA helicase